jgi:hypothetical protein
MAHIIPALRTTSHPAYTPAVRRSSDHLAAAAHAATSAGFGALLKAQSAGAAATSTLTTSPALSGSLLRNQVPPSDRPAVAPAGYEGTTSTTVTNATTAAPRSQPVTSTTTAQTVAAPAAAPAPSFFPGTNIPTQNPFGPDPYFTNPTQNIFAGNGSSQMVRQSLAPYYFPTQQTAQTVAQLFGGTVFVQSQDSLCPFTLNQPTYMVRLANGTEINPGIISHIYDTRSDTPAQLQQMVQDVVNGGTMATLQPNPLAYATT